MFFPISDDNPTLRTPVATWLLIGGIFVVWFLVEGGGMGSGLALITSVCNYGMVPGELTHRAPIGEAVPLGMGLACVVDNQSINVLTPLTSMFLHGSWGHILGNCLFLWVFGNNIEDSMGKGRFLAFYFICGLVAAAVHVLIDPTSPIPTVGASGAISGILGAYLVLYPRVRVNVLMFIVIFFKVFSVPAWIVLIWWFVVQVLAGLPALSPVRPEVSTGGVAVWAHIGGFIAGLVLVRLFESPRLVAERNAVRFRTLDASRPW